MARYVWPSAALLGYLSPSSAGAFARSPLRAIKLDQKFFLCIFCFSREIQKMSGQPTREELLRRQKNWQAPVRIGILHFACLSCSRHVDSMCACRMDQRKAQQEREQLQSGWDVAGCWCSWHRCCWCSPGDGKGIVLS